MSTTTNPFELLDECDRLFHRWREERTKAADKFQAAMEAADEMERRCLRSLATSVAMLMHARDNSHPLLNRWQCIGAAEKATARHKIQTLAIARLRSYASRCLIATGRAPQANRGRILELVETASIRIPK